MFVEIKRYEDSNYVRVLFGGVYVFVAKKAWDGMIGTAVQKAYRVWDMVGWLGHCGGKIMWLDFVGVCRGEVVVRVNEGDIEVVI